MIENSKHLPVKLPSERSFGLLFTAVFVLAGCYAYYKGYSMLSVAAFIVVGALFFGVTMLAPTLLAPLNKAWFMLGLLLGKIVNPIVMGVIFFAIITPVALGMKLAGRDALRLRKPKLPKSKIPKQDVSSYWIDRNPTGPDSASFKNQF